MKKLFYVAKWQVFFAALVVIVIVVASCTKQNEETLKAQGGTVTCDTTNMQYTANIVPILAANCYSCHANGIVNGGVTFDGYANVVVQVKNGNLIGAITHAPGYTPMPFDGGKLSDCDIATIQAWINAGAPDN